ncbi:hypothetical protein K0651_07255 [Ornithinimicrobium sp. Arc0846-15]|nr:hypothetical protein [Ornithinimicrobium laminariae]
MRRYFVAAALALGLALSACSDAGEPSMPPSGDGARSTTAAPSDEQVIATTEAPSEDAEPTAMPTSEMEESVEGAEAFALEYFGLLIGTLIQPAEGLLLENAGEACTGCESFEGNVAYLVANGLSVPSDPTTINEVTSQVSGDTYVVQINFAQDTYWTVDEDQNKVDEYPGAPAVLMQINLTWHSGAWQVDSLATQDL